MRKDNHLLTRVFTSICLIAAILVGIFALPQWLWGLVLLAPIAIAAFEYSRLFGWKKWLRVGFVATVICLCLPPFMLLNQFTQVIGLIGVVVSWRAVLFWMLLVPCLIRDRVQTGNHLYNAMIGILVIVPAWFAMVALHPKPYVLLAVLVGVWLVDISGYFVGRKFGKIKLLPSVSPGKTCEGVLGGFVVICVYGLSLSLIFDNNFSITDLSLFIVIVVGFVAICVLGDLFESHLKRNAGSKDSGSILPGHGGLLDRVDSMIALLPFSFLVIQIF